MTDATKLADRGWALKRQFKLPSEVMGWINEAATVLTRTQPGTPSRETAHALNEWADLACNSMQWLRNIKDGISTADEALAETKTNYERVSNLSKVALRATPAPTTEPVAPDRAGIEHVLWGLNDAIDLYWNEGRTDGQVKNICYWQFKAKEALALFAAPPVAAPEDAVGEALKSFIEAFDNGAVELNSAEIDPGDEQQPYPWHEEWISRARAALYAALPAKDGAGSQVTRPGRGTGA